MLVIAADDEVEAAFILFGRDQPQFLRELVDFLALAHRRTEQQRNGDAEGIARPDPGLVVDAVRFAFAIAGHAGQRGEAVIVGHVEREAEGFAVKLLRGRRHVALVGLVIGQAFAHVETLGAQCRNLGPCRAPRTSAGGRAVEHDRVKPVGIVIGVIGDDDRGELGIERFEGHLSAQLDAVDIVEIDIVHDVLIETVAVAHLECEAGGDRFGQRPGHMAAHQLLVVIAIGCGQAAAIGKFGARAVNADRAADHVLAQQHALRPADHLDAIDIEQVEVEQARTTHVNVIDEDPDRLVGGGRVEAGIGDPANVEFLVERRQRGKGQRGRLPCEILERQRPVFLQRIARKGRDRGRSILDRCLAALRGDDNCRQLVFVALRSGALVTLRILRLRGAGCCHRGHQR